MKKRPLLTRHELAAKLKVHAQTINAWAADGMPVAVRGRGGRPSQYDEAAVRAWVEERREAAESGGPVDLTRERARREHAQALLAEQTHAIRAGELLHQADVEKLWTAEVVAVRAHLLSWSTALADRLYRAGVQDGLVGVERELTAATRQVLTELSDPARPLPCPHCGRDIGLKAKDAPAARKAKAAPAAQKAKAAPAARKASRRRPAKSKGGGRARVS